MAELIKNKKLIFIAVSALILGFLLVILSDSPKKPDNETKKAVFDESVYQDELEKRLRDIISRIDGVGDVSVMITLDGSALYTFATDTVRDTKSDGNSKRESTVVLSSGGTNSKEAVISGYSLPEIKGVAVVCSKRLSSTTRAKVIGVASAALGIKTSKIYVTD